MKTRIVFLLFLILSSCSSTKIVDNLPKDSPKGYAEFFCRNDKNYISYNQKISLVRRKGEYVFIGKIYPRGKNADSNKRGYLIAQTPGYRYVSTSKDTYHFEIKEGMVIPIEVKLRISVSKIMQPWGLIDEINIKTDICPPGEFISITKYKIKKERR
jgi:hypothetical protein